MHEYQSQEGKQDPAYSHVYMTHITQYNTYIYTILWLQYIIKLP